MIIWQASLTLRGDVNLLYITFIILILLQLHFQSLNGDASFNLRFVIRHIWGHVKFVPLVSYFLKDDGCFLLQHVSAYLTMPHLTWTQTSLTLSTDPMLRGDFWSSIDAKIMDLLLEKCCWMATADPMYQSGQCINNGDVSSWLGRQAVLTVSGVTDTRPTTHHTHHRLDTRASIGNFPTN